MTDLTKLGNSSTRTNHELKKTRQIHKFLRKDQLEFDFIYTDQRNPQFRIMN